MTRSAHQIGLTPAKGGHIRRPCRRIIAHNELVQLRWGYGGRGHHRMDLSAMVGLMLKQMRHEIIRPVMLLPLAVIHSHNPAQTIWRQPLHQRQQPSIRLHLRRNQSLQRCQRLGVVQCSKVQPIALQRIDIKPIHQQNMVQRRPDRREKTHPWCGIILCRQPRAGAMQAVVGKTVHLRQFTPHAARIRG